MSSVYHVVCLSHDPAIRVARWENDGRDAAIAAALNPTSHEDLAHHEHCDLMVGRYSYPLVELCCPARGNAGHRRHSADNWLDSDILKLLYAALNEDGSQRLATAANHIANRGCWSETRLQRLRVELGFETPFDDIAAAHPLG